MGHLRHFRDGACGQGRANPASLRARVLGDRRPGHKEAGVPFQHERALPDQRALERGDDEDGPEIGHEIGRREFREKWCFGRLTQHLEALGCRVGRLWSCRYAANKPSLRRRWRRPRRRGDIAAGRGARDAGSWGSRRCSRAGRRRKSCGGGEGWRQQPDSRGACAGPPYYGADRVAERLPQAAHDLQELSHAGRAREARRDARRRIDQWQRPPRHWRGGGEWS
mmetsp:Transcript_46917/g.130673  ORF Transcript_46917/g.130673 Transcript_46917/m.130673 type:complete len:224 (-) Transcript_46917:314-985(-)